MSDNNFYSIDRLVEFGMGIAVAQQMVKSMNHTMQNIQPLVSTATPAAPATKNFHIIVEGKPAGPFTDVEMSRLITEGKIKKDTYVWCVGMANWALAENVPDVLRLVVLAPPPFNPEN